jgi:hypothetical protein
MTKIDDKVSNDWMLKLLKRAYEYKNTQTIQPNHNCPNTHIACRTI